MDMDDFLTTIYPAPAIIILKYICGIVTDQVCQCCKVCQMKVLESSEFSDDSGCQSGAVIHSDIVLYICSENFNRSCEVMSDICGVSVSRYLSEVTSELD